MTKEKKVQQIAELTEILSGSNVVYVADLEGMDAATTSDFRRQAFKNNIKIRVVKNTLLQKAMESIDGKNYSEMFPTLKGNTAILVGDTGNGPAKMIREIRRKSDKPIIKSAFIDDSVYVGDNYEELSNIKSKEELVGEIIGLLQSPIKNLIGALQSGQNTITGVLKTLENK